MWTVVAMAFLIALAAGAFDLVPLRIDDNLTIPLFVGFVTWIITDLFGVSLG
jgi:dolichol kinase